MKKIFFLTTIAIMIAVGISFLPSTAKADNLGLKLSGRILLAVESNGETWYVSPINQQRYFLREPLNALNIMQQTGLGISNNDFDSFKGKAPVKLSGKILLKVQDRGMAYYVNPTDLKMHFLGKPDQALKVMQSLSLGISNSNLEKIYIPENVNISITNSGFSPANLIINRGAMVTWTNYTSSFQTIISPNCFNFEKVTFSRTYNHMFNITGTYHYYSSDNTSIAGTIIVK